MGTLEFAVHSLNILVEAGYDIVAVITSVDKLGGRGRKTVMESPVKKYALSKSLKVLQPKNLKSPKFIEELMALKADLQIVVAFRMLPEIVWNMPRHGTYNLHGSLLPKYRGAAPINWAIMKGETVTGVTSFKLKHEIDTGSLLFKKEIPIYPSDNAGDLHDRMKFVAAEVVLDTVLAIENDKLDLIPQDESGVTHAPKLNPENTKINFDQSVEEVYNHIRGLSPFPGSWFDMGVHKVKVYQSAIHHGEAKHQPGIILSDNKTKIDIACANGYIQLLEIQFPGKKRMDVRTFLNGFDISQYAFMAV